MRMGIITTESLIDEHGGLNTRIMESRGLNESRVELVFREQWEETFA